MRLVRSDKDLKLRLFNRYGIPLKDFLLKADEPQELPYFKENFTLKSEECKEVFIYEGVGEVDLNKCYTHYDFKNLNYKLVDIALQKGEIYNKKVSDFIEVLETNLQADKMLINPPYYKKVLSELLEGGGYEYSL
ncbi:MAG: hypothetical protein PUB96_08650 [Helicobacteraceae bacterium]|nr:hypothetical protein [Helicobacteraceae bacterium]